MSCCPHSNFPRKYLIDGNSPKQVVELYQKAFGTPRMDEIGPYTTENFRNDLPITVWVNRTWNTLNQMEYEKTAFKILEIEYNENKDAVKITVATKLNTAAASATQKEIYLLIKKEDYWLVDELIVSDEILDDEVFEL